MQKSINNDLFDLTVKQKENKILINGYIKNYNSYKKMVVIAPNPPDKRTSYSGTALPFPSEDIAFENTKNYFEIKNDGKINIEFLYPNSYYTPDGYTKIISPIIVKKSILYYSRMKCNTYYALLRNNTVQVILFCNFSVL